jgi:hypothetical protein
MFKSGVNMSLLPNSIGRRISSVDISFVTNTPSDTFHVHGWAVLVLYLIRDGNKKYRILVANVLWNILLKGTYEDRRILRQILDTHFRKRSEQFS